MRPTLCATLNTTGSPCAEVPFTCMWELVEYLSFQRVAVTYCYQPTHFTVTLPHMDLAAVQRLLDDWEHAGPADSGASWGGTWRASVPPRFHVPAFSGTPFGGPAPPESR